MLLWRGLEYPQLDELFSESCNYNSSPLTYEGRAVARQRFVSTRDELNTWQSGAVSGYKKTKLHKASANPCSTFHECLMRSQDKKEFSMRLGAEETSRYALYSFPSRSVTSRVCINSSGLHLFCNTMKSEL